MTVENAQGGSKGSGLLPYNPMVTTGAAFSPSSTSDRATVPSASSSTASDAAAAVSFFDILACVVTICILHRILISHYPMLSDLSTCMCARTVTTTGWLCRAHTKWFFQGNPGGMWWPNLQTVQTKCQKCVLSVMICTSACACWKLE